MRTAREAYSKRATDTVQGFNKALKKPILENSLLPSMQKTRKGMKRPEVGTRSVYLEYCGRQNLRGRKKRSRPEAPQKSNTPESNKKWRRSLGRGKAGRRTRREEKGERNEEEDARLWMRSVSTSERAPARERTKPALVCWRRRERGTGDKSSGLNCRFTSWLRWRRPAALLTCCSRGGGGKNIKMA